MSAADKAMPGGQPSITQPIAGPCDSPKVVTENNLPNELPDMEHASNGETFILPAPAAWRRPALPGPGGDAARLISPGNVSFLIGKIQFNLLHNNPLYT
jgi:hypothetical protein